MKIIRTAGIALMLVAVLAALVSSVDGECTACQGGSATAQQDLLNSEWAVFMGDENATTAGVITSANGLISPQYSRANNQLVQAGNNGTASDKPNLNSSPSEDSSPSVGTATGMVASSSKPVNREKPEVRVNPGSCEGCQ